MTTKDLLLGLFRHMEWADATVLRLVLGSPAAAADARTRERLRHLHMVQRAFLSVWRDEPFDPMAGRDFDGPALAAWARDAHGELTPFVEAIEEAALDRPVVLPWAKFVVAFRATELSVPTLGETVLQVAAHSTYHRGQVNARPRELAIEPPLVDFIAWVWFGKPRPEWPT